MKGPTPHGSELSTCLRSLIFVRGWALIQLWREATVTIDLASRRPASLRSKLRHRSKLCYTACDAAPLRSVVGVESRRAALDHVAMPWSFVTSTPLLLCHILTGTPSPPTAPCSHQESGRV